MGEVNSYEKDAIESFKTRQLERNNEFKAEIIKFHSETLKYLEEFQIDDKVIDEFVHVANKLSHDLTKKDEATKYTILEFVRKDLLESSLFGSLFNPHERSTLKCEPLKLQKPNPPTVHQTVRFDQRAFEQQQDPPNDPQATHVQQRAFWCTPKLVLEILKFLLIAIISVGLLTFLFRSFDSIRQSYIWECIPKPILVFFPSYLLVYLCLSTEVFSDSP
jgi:hypothetical protein